MAGPLFVRLRLGEGAEVVRSQVIHDGGADKVFFHFERPTQDGFDSARSPDSLSFEKWVFQAPQTFEKWVFRHL